MVTMGRWYGELLLSVGYANVYVSRYFLGASVGRIGSRNRPFCHCGHILGLKAS